MKIGYSLKKLMKVNLAGRFGSKQIITLEYAFCLQGGGYYAYDSNGNVYYQSDSYNGGAGCTLATKPKLEICKRYVWIGKTVVCRKFIEGLLDSFVLRVFGKRSGVSTRY